MMDTECVCCEMRNEYFSKIKGNSKLLHNAIIQAASRSQKNGFMELDKTNPNTGNIRVNKLMAERSSLRPFK